MNALPLNSEISRRLRGRFNFAFGFLPIGLMFAAFLPIWSFAKWLAATLGIPDHAPVKDQPNGLLYFVLFLTVAIGLMLCGVALGWLLNALICWVVLRWPHEKIRRVFLESDVPQEWLKEGSATPSTMCGSIQQADEVAGLQYLQFRQSLVRSWLRISGFTLIGALALLAFLRLRIGFPPNELIVICALVPLVLPGLLLGSTLLLARFVRDRWQWDDSGITMRGRRYRWKAFQSFRIDHESLPAGFATFSIQFRDRFMSRGIVFGITARTSEVEALAESARKNISKVP